MSGWVAGGVLAVVVLVGGEWGGGEGVLYQDDRETAKESEKGWETGEQSLGLLKNCSAQGQRGTQYCIQYSSVLRHKWGPLGTRAGIGRRLGKGKGSSSL